MANDNVAEKPKKRNKFKEVFSELKKVTWPTFGKVVKQTGTVLVVTIFFLLVLLAMDQLLALGYGQLTKGLQDTASAVQTAVVNVSNSLFSGIGSTAASFPLLF